LSGHPAADPQRDQQREPEQQPPAAASNPNRGSKDAPDGFGSCTLLLYFIDNHEDASLKIVTVGRGRIGGGLAAIWSKAGHEVTTLGRDGGDGSAADVVLVAAALANVTGIDGKVTLDATNSYGQRIGEFASLAHQIKSIIGGPTAKSFNTNWAALYDRIGEQRVPPGNLFAADPDARQVAEQLIVDAGFDPVFAGDLENARLLEDHLPLTQAVASAGLGPFFCRIAKPGQL
jgi:predicted dinucleotide-binding enzyme